MSGFLSRKPRVVTATGNVLASDEVLLADVTGGSIVLTLPLAGTYRRDNQRIITIQKIDSSANAVVISGVIENMSSYQLMNKGEYISIYAYNGVWKIIDRAWTSAGVKYPIGISSASYNGTADIPVSIGGWDASRVLFGSARQSLVVANGIAMNVPFVPPGLYELQFNGDFRAGSGGFDARAFFRCTTVGDVGFMHVQNFPSALNRGMSAVFFIPTAIVNFDVHVRWQTTNVGTSIQIFNGNGFTDESHLSMKPIAWNG